MDAGTERHFPPSAMALGARRRRKPQGTRCLEQGAKEFAAAKSIDRYEKSDAIDSRSVEGSTARPDVLRLDRMKRRWHRGLARPDAPVPSCYFVSLDLPYARR